jgi:hypothetical protein
MLNVTVVAVIAVTMPLNVFLVLYPKGDGGMGT